MTRELKHCACLGVMSEHGHIWHELNELASWLSRFETSVPEGQESKNIWNVQEARMQRILWIARGKEKTKDVY